MKIEMKTVYRYKGAWFDSPDQIKTKVENQLGVIIDSMDVTITSKQKLKILEAMVKNRKLIRELLNVEIDLSADPMVSEMRNILNY